MTPDQPTAPNFTAAAIEHAALAKRVQAERNPPAYRPPNMNEADAQREPTATATPKDQLSETPMTDAEAEENERITPGGEHSVSTHFARLLEKRLTTAQAALAEAQAKLSERKTVHEWLNANGVPAVEEGGRPMCLLRRLAVALKIQPHKSP